MTGTSSVLIYRETDMTVLDEHVFLFLWQFQWRHPSCDYTWSVKLSGVTGWHLWLLTAWEKQQLVRSGYIQCRDSGLTMEYDLGMIWWVASMQWAHSLYLPCSLKLKLLLCCAIRTLSLASKYFKHFAGTWFWKWLLLRLSKRRTITIIFRTTPTQTISLYELVNNLWWLSHT